MQSLAGHLLVASPSLENSPFSGTVVLVLQHTEEAAWGVVLNRLADVRLATFWKEVSDQPCAVDQQVNLGGPISGPVLAVHRWQPLADAAVPPGVFLAAEKEHLERLVRQTEHPFRIFVGLSGWTAGQLEHELEEGVWLTTPAGVEHVFGEPDELWPKSLRDVGRAFTRSLGIKHIPDDASLN